MITLPKDHLHSVPPHLPTVAALTIQYIIPSNSYSSSLITALDFLLNSLKYTH